MHGLQSFLLCRRIIFTTSDHLRKFSFKGTFCSDFTPEGMSRNSCFHRVFMGNCNKIQNQSNIKSVLVVRWNHVKVYRTEPHVQMNKAIWYDEMNQKQVRSIGLQWNRRGTSSLTADQNILGTRCCYLHYGSPPLKKLQPLFGHCPNGHL